MEDRDGFPTKIS